MEVTIKYVKKYLPCILGYLFRLSIAVDQLINTIFGGSPDETISARAYRTKNKWLEIPINILFAWQYNGKWHCEQCYIYEQNRGDLPKEYQSHEENL